MSAWTNACAIIFPSTMSNQHSTRGLVGLKNGDLLNAAESAGFDVLLTVDRGFEYQQNLAGRRIAVVILRTKSIALEKLLRIVPACLARLDSIQPGEVATIT
jgi:hypothetical protein